MKLKSISNTVEDTQRIAHKFAKSLKGDEIVLLKGELGAGKTLFVKAVADFFDCGDIINSPTFTIFQRYNCKNKQIYHFDLYRIKSVLEVENFGFFEYLEDDAVKFIEWPEKIELEGMLEEYYLISIFKKGESLREIIIERKGD